LSQKRLVLAISISTGWAVRNFFQTEIVEKLKKYFHVLIFTTPAIHKNLVEQGYGIGINFAVRGDLVEPLSWRLFRQLKKKIYMESRNSSTEAIWGKFVKRPLYQRVGGKFINFVLRMVNADRLLSLIEDLDFTFNSCSRTNHLFRQYKPDLFFATHASTFFEESLLHSSIKNNVPVVFMVLSWDHLSSKIVLSKKYRSIYVWNNLTKSEILQTCSAYTDKQIKVVGVPQYDIYAQKPDINYAEWCQRCGLDPAKQTILFSTMPQVRHEQQHIIIQNILSSIVTGEKLPTNLQVLIKCHPFDNDDKYDYLLGKYPVALLKSTLTKGKPHGQWFPSQHEMTISRDVLYFCDININIFSTVTLEAAYFDKPIIHIAFDPNPIENRIPCKEYYNFEHFKNITKMQASIMAFNYDELFSGINDYLANKNIKSEQRSKLVTEYFNILPGKAAENVVQMLNAECSRK